MPTKKQCVRADSTYDSSGAEYKSNVMAEVVVLVGHVLVTRGNRICPACSLLLLHYTALLHLLSTCASSWVSHHCLQRRPRLVNVTNRTKQKKLEKRPS